MPSRPTKQNQIWLIFEISIYDKMFRVKNRYLKGIENQQPGHCFDYQEVVKKYHWINFQ